MNPAPLRIDVDDALPVYAQIERQIRLKIGAGVWRPGDQIPSVREMAVRLRINPLTVQKVYRRLAEDGVLHSRPGAGVYVAENASRANDAGDRARKAVEEAVEQAMAAGLPAEKIARIVERRLASMTEQS